MSSSALPRMFRRLWPVLALWALLWCGLAALPAPSAAAQDKPPADPCAYTPALATCLTSRLLVTPWNALEAGGPLVAAHAVDALGRKSEVRLYAPSPSGRLLYRGALAGAYAPVHLREGYLFAGDAWGALVMARVPPEGAPWLIQRLAARSGVILEIAAQPGVVALLRGKSGGADGKNQIEFHAHPPQQPLSLSSVLTSTDARAIKGDSGMVYAITGRGYVAFNVNNPALPFVQGEVLLFSQPITGPYQIEHGFTHTFVMARDAATGAPLCKRIEITGKIHMRLKGDCPFVPGRTTFFGAYVYVNPNPGPAEYLDYEVWQLGEADTPQRVRYERERWVKGVLAGELRVTQSHAGSLVTYSETPLGALERLTETWTLDQHNDWDDPLLAADTTVLVDGGSTEGGRRVLFMDVASAPAPQLMGELVSPWLSTSRLALRAGRLYSLHRNTLVLFDVVNPAAPAQLGVTALPEGVDAQGWVVPGNGLVHVAGKGNLLVTLSTANPVTPTVLSLVDIPGETEAMLWQPGHLYLFGGDSMAVVDVSDPYNPLLLRIVPIPAGIREVASWGSALYLLRGDTLEILDARTAATPRPAATLQWEEETVEFMAVEGGRLFVVQRARYPLPRADEFFAAVYDLANPLNPQLQARVGPLPGPAMTPARDRVITPVLNVYTLGGSTRSVQIMAAGAVFVPDATIEYRLGQGFVAEQVYCLAHTEIPESAPVMAGTRTLYAGAFALAVDDCASGAPLGLGSPVSLTVRYTPTASALLDWPQAEIVVAGDSGWENAPGTQNDGTGEIFALINPLIPWAVAGPPSQPVRLTPVLRGTP